jgi:hypothetical protein
MRTAAVTVSTITPANWLELQWPASPAADRTDDMNRISPSIDADEHELAHAYHDLGTAAFALVHNGALSDPRLSSRVRRIYELTDVHPSRTGACLRPAVTPAYA